MKPYRFAAAFAALFATVMLGGCAKTNEVTSTESAPAAGDAAPPEAEAATPESSTETPPAAETTAPSEGEAPQN